MDWPEPVSMERRLAWSSSCERTMWGTTAKTISSSWMVWSLEPKRYLRMGMELSPGMPVQLSWLLIVLDAAEDAGFALAEADDLVDDALA